MFAGEHFLHRVRNMSSRRRRQTLTPRLYFFRFRLAGDSRPYPTAFIVEVHRSFFSARKIGRRPTTGFVRGMLWAAFFVFASLSPFHHISQLLLHPLRFIFT
jgi:hypothetical protein